MANRRMLVAFLCMLTVVSASTTAACISQKRSDGALLLYAPKSPNSAQNTAFSPKGDRVLYTIFHGGYNEGPGGLYLLKLSDGSRTKLLDEADHDSVNVPGTCWRSKNNRITFASDRGGKDDIWTIRPEGSGLRKVTSHTSSTFYVEPTFSPDGKWIVFEESNEAPEVKQQGSIYKVKSDGSGLTELTGGPKTGTDDRLPNWSPAGDRILFQRRRAGSDDWDIYTMTPDVKNLRRVTGAASADTDASWSPDGKWIVYSSDHGGLPVPNIFIVKAGGGKPVRVTKSKANEDGAPSWSPDGKWITFESHTGSNEDSPSALWRIRAPSCASRTAGSVENR